MVQAPTPHQSQKKRVKASLPLVSGLVVVIVMVVLVAIFFRVGVPEQDEPKAVSPRVLREINAHLIKSGQARKNGKLKAAIEESERAIQVMEREKSNDWIQMTTLLVAISDMYRESGQWDKGLPPLEKARELVKKYHLEEERITIEVLLRQGIFNYMNKDFVEAEDQFQQAESCAQTLTGSLSVETSQCLIWLAQSYLSPAFHNPKRALQYLRMVEEVCGSSNPERPQQMMLCQKVQGEAYLQMKKLPEAEEKLLSAQEIAARIYPPNHHERTHLANLLELIRADKSAAEHRSKR